MKNKRNWAIALILTTAAGFISVQSRIAPKIPAAVTETKSSANILTVETNTEAAAPAYEGCSYMWAYHEAPELTEKFNALIGALDPNAKTRVSFYGEDCIYADGHADFSVMETDFYVRLPVEDLTNHERFGNWMAQVMPVVIQIPREEIKGNYGFVEFWFEKSETENAIVRIPIQQYINEAQGKSGIDLYKMFSSALN